MRKVRIIALYWTMMLKCTCVCKLQMRYDKYKHILSGNMGLSKESKNEENE